MPEVSPTELESEELRNGIENLRDGTCVVLDSKCQKKRCFVIGTAHVSEESALEVAQVSAVAEDGTVFDALVCSQLVKLVKPDAVLLELCPARYIMISKAQMDQQKADMSLGRMVSAIRAVHHSQRTDR